MYSLAFSILFVTFFVLTLALRFWLSARQMRHVVAHRGAVPADFAEKISLASHQKAAAYTVAKTQFGLASLLFSSAVTLGFTLLGGLQWLSFALLPLAGPGMAFQITLLLAFMAIGGLLDLPFDYYRQFVLEQRFGFNKMTLGLWLFDMLKGVGLGLVLGLPLLWVVLTLMAKAGSLWWIYAWLVMTGFQLLIMFIYPTVIAPIFNKFKPLEDSSLTERINDLMRRTGFVSKGLFVMDCSTRSNHGNAYFSGFGATKRVVFFDTLLQRLAPAEIEAVLAHELGHFKLNHNLKRQLMAFAVSLVFFAVLGYLKNQSWFYTGLGVDPLLGVPNDATAIILFMLALPVFTFALAPLASISSRKHEFEADAFAAAHANKHDLIAALVKMYNDNASTLTPDELHSTFYDSHPHAAIRINHLNLAAP